MQDYKLTNAERETTITYDDGTKEARIYTCNESMKRKLRTMLSNAYVSLCAADKYSETYIIPKSWVKIRLPRVVSEEEHAIMATAMRERMGHAKQGE